MEAPHALSPHSDTYQASSPHPLPPRAPQDKKAARTESEPAIRSPALPPPSCVTGGQVTLPFCASVSSPV